MSKYHFNNFGGLVLFSLPPKRFFARFLLRSTQRTRRYITLYVWISRDVGGACTGRLKSLGLALFSGAASPNQKRRHHDMKTGKGTLSSGVFTSVSGLFSIMWQERLRFCTWRPFLTSAPRRRWRTHVLNFLSNSNTAVATAEPVRMDGHDNTAANRLHISLASNCVRDKIFLPRATCNSSGHQEPAR